MGLRSEIETPTGDITREATAARRGYLYQDYRVALHWFGLGENEVLFVEVAEDYITASEGTLEATQVKNVSSPISLAERSAIKALQSFVDLTTLNTDKGLTYVFLTTARPAVEKRVKHRACSEGGINYWQQVQKGADIKPLRRALLAMNLGQRLKTFIVSKTDQQLHDDLVARFRWLTGSASLDALKAELTEKVVSSLSELEVARSDAKKYVDNIMMHVTELSAHKDRNKRRLDKRSLADLLDSFARISITRREYSELQQKAALAENRPIDLLDEHLAARVLAIKHSRHFVGYERQAEAARLACDVSRGGMFAGASNEMRATAMSWAARLLLDDQDGRAAELLETASALAVNSESVLLVNAIRTASNGVSGAMAMLASRDSPEVMTARYLIHRRSAQGAKAIKVAIKWFKSAGAVINTFDEDGQALILNDLMRSKCWVNAIDIAQMVSGDACEHPYLLWNCALAALCETTPKDRREEILDRPPLWDLLHFPLSATVNGINAKARAIKLFERLHKIAKCLKLALLSNNALEYLLWLRLTNAHSDPDTLSEVETLIGATEGWERWVPLAISSGLRLDLMKVRRQLDQRYVRCGTLDFHSSRALLATLLAPGTTATAAEWRAIRPRVAPHFRDIFFLVSLEVQAHLRDNALAEARAALSVIGDSPEAARLRRQMENLISERGGEDVVARRQAEFSLTDETFDLEQLMISLSDSRRWSELARYSRMMFERLNSVEAAERHVTALKKASQWKEVGEFFEKFPEFSEKSSLLAGLHAHTALLLSDWAAAGQIIRRSNRAMVAHVQFQSSLLSFQWSKFNTQIDSALDIPRSYDPNYLLQLATVAAVIDRASDSKLLTSHAANASPDEPRILFSAFLQAARGMWDEEESPGGWLKRAVEDPSSNEVIQRKSLSDLVELAPIWRERMARSWSAIQTGNLWLAEYGKWTNQHLSHITVGTAVRNHDEPDVRKRSIIPAFSGARIPLPLANGKRVGIDPTALLNLAYLGLLERLQEIYSTVAVPHQTGAWLMEEFEHAKFHQPRHIKEASDLMLYIALDKIRICPEVACDDKMLVFQVGLELADLLGRARAIHSSGSGSGNATFVICTSPVHLVDSLMQKHAILDDYFDVLRSPTCLVNSLYRLGILTQQEIEKAHAFMGTIDSGWRDDAHIPQGAELFFDSLAINYLQALGLLEKLASSSFKLVVHANLRDRAGDYAALQESGRQHHKLLGRVREFLTQGAKSGLVEVLPLPFECWGESEELSSYSLDLFRIQGRFDSILIDDRFFNRHSSNQEQAGSSIPIHCTLDVLDHLRDIKKIQNSDWLTYRTMLRRSGYALIPVHQTELLEAAAASALLAQEGLDLRAIRESVALIQIRGLLDLPTEHPWLVTLVRGCNRTLVNLARDPASPKRVKLLEWLLELVDVKDFGHSLPAEISREAFRSLELASYLVLLSDALFTGVQTEQPDELAKVFERLRFRSPPSHHWLGMCQPFPELFHHEFK